ncbi:hypothetical protein [Sphingomonas sp. RT2P30]|uniref:hypothetical protein n=1 Tax=Parasphingomonas halimpatiens TaxID=3096162 RepID=UPI002FC8C29F
MQPILSFAIVCLVGGGPIGLLFAAVMFLFRVIDVPGLAVGPIVGLALLPALAAGAVTATLSGAGRFWLFCLASMVAGGLAMLSILLVTDFFDDSDGPGVALMSSATVLAAGLCAVASYLLGRRISPGPNQTA